VVHFGAGGGGEEPGDIIAAIELVGDSGTALLHARQADGKPGGGLSPTTLTLTKPIFTAFST